MKVLRSVSITILLMNSVAPSDDVRTLPKKVTSENGIVVASGRWVLTTPFEFPPLSQRNSVEIVCNKARGICHEAIAALYTKDDVPQMNGQFLTAVISEYKVTRWNASGIVAISAKPVADVKIQIDLQQGTAKRRYQETKARGSQTANPSLVVDWELK